MKHTVWIKNFRFQPQQLILQQPMVLEFRVGSNQSKYSTLQSIFPRSIILRIEELEIQSHQLLPGQSFIQKFDKGKYSVTCMTYPGMKMKVVVNQRKEAETIICVRKKEQCVYQMSRMSIKSQLKLSDFNWLVSKQDQEIYIKTIKPQIEKSISGVKNKLDLQKQTNYDSINESSQQGCFMNNEKYDLFQEIQEDQNHSLYQVIFSFCKTNKQYLNEIHSSSNCNLNLIRFLKFRFNLVMNFYQT